MDNSGLSNGDACISVIETFYNRPNGGSVATARRRTEQRSGPKIKRDYLWDRFLKHGSKTVFLYLEPSVKVRDGAKCGNSVNMVNSLICHYAILESGNCSIVSNLSKEWRRLLISVNTIALWLSLQEFQGLQRCMWHVTMLYKSFISRLTTIIK